MNSHTTTRRIALVCLALVGIACARNPRPEDAPTAAQSAPLRLRMPREIGEFKFVERTDYENPALGHSLRYRAPDSLSFDVYVYPAPDGPDCDRACLRELLTKEREEFVGGIPEMVSRGYAQAMRVTDSDALVPPRSSLWDFGHRMTLSIRRQDQDHSSEYWLLHTPGNWVKLRSTYVGSSARDRRISSLLPILVSTLQNATDVIPERIDRPLPETATADSMFAILHGVWDWRWSEDECRAGEHRISFTPDRSDLLLVSAPMEAGEAPDTTRYRITRSGPGILTWTNWAMRMEMAGEDRKTEDGKLVVWDLVLESRDRYHWHRTDWPKGALTDAVIRCDGPIKPL